MELTVIANTVCMIDDATIVLVSEVIYGSLSVFLCTVIVVRHNLFDSVEGTSSILERDCSVVIKGLIDPICYSVWWAT